MNDNYRTATKADHAYIVRLLADGNRGVLVRSMFRSDQDPYPLLDITKGPFGITAEGITGFSLDGEVRTLRITETSLGHVEMRQGDGDWYAPELSGIVLLVPK